MKALRLKLVVAVAAMAAMAAVPAQAQVRVTEVAPWSSGTLTVGADWFELTNIGSSAVSISGWKMDDNSNSFASSVALIGITSIAAGQSVIFIESSAATIATNFNASWFGGSPPAGLLIGTYSGGGVGLATAGDAVNIYNGSGVLQANVAFGASSSVVPLQTFDNAAGLNNATISQISVVGVNGAFTAFGGGQIGSPGTIVAVPEVGTVTQLLAGMFALGFVVLRRRQS